MNSSKKIGYYTLLSGFLIHLILGTLHSWPSIYRYFHSYLVQHNSIKISKQYLNNTFSFVIIFYNIFILIGVILTKNYDSITITGCGLLLKMLANIIPIFFPNIIIVTLCIFICSAGCGICYMPVILEIWKYYPKNKGLTTSIALSGFGLTQLIFEDISINIINYEKHKIDYIEGIYSYYVNDNFNFYLKTHTIFFSIVSILSIIFLYPHDKYKKFLRTLTPKYSFQFKSAIKNMKHNNQYELDPKFSQSARSLDVESKNTGSDYLSTIKSFFLKKKEKKRISSNKIYEEEDIHYFSESKNDLDSKLITDINLVKMPNEKKKNLEIFFTLITSYPFLQLTSTFFFTKIFGIIELNSIKNFGLLNGHDEDFLWYGSFLFKFTNFLSFILWGYLFDKIGFKKLYRIIITLEILISSICYYISAFKFGYLIYCSVSALVNSASMAIGPTNYSIIFDNEKGALLFGISCFLTNTFYIFRPLISNLLTEKIYYLIIYLIITLFSMLGFIILCFFIDEKLITNNSRNNSKDDDNNDTEFELKEINDSEKVNSSNNESISKANNDTDNTGYYKDRNELFSEKENDESSTF